MSNIKINYSGNSFATTHSRDYYRGKSFHFAGEWVEGKHYTSDDYNIDFVSKDNVLLACAKSHLSTLDNEPLEWTFTETGYIDGVVSKYWDFVLSGRIGDNGKVYVPSYNQNTGILTWVLLSEDEIPEGIPIDLQLTGIINAAIARADLAINELENTANSLISRTDIAVATANNAAQDAVRQARFAAEATSETNSARIRIEELFASGLRQETGTDTQAIMSQNAVTVALDNKISKVQSPIVGDLCILDSQGNVVDSETALTDVVKHDDISMASQSDINTILALLQ